MLIWYSKHPSVCKCFIFIHGTTVTLYSKEIYVSTAQQNWRFFIKMLIRKKIVLKITRHPFLCVAHNSGSKHIKAAVEIWDVMCICICVLEWSMFRAWPKHILAAPTRKSSHGTELSECDAVPGWWYEMQQTIEHDTLVCHSSFCFKVQYSLRQDFWNYFTARDSYDEYQKI